MLPKITALFLLLSGSPVVAGEFRCRADFDETSHYEFHGDITGTGISGPLELRYLSSDGIDLKGTLTAKTATFAPGAALSLTAANDSMGAELKTTFDPASKSYLGTLAISFDLDQSSPAEQNASCTVQ